MYQSGKAHLYELIKVIVAARAIGTQPDINLHVQHLRHRGDAGRQLEVDRRTVRYVSPGPLQSVQLRPVYVDAVSKNRPWAEQAHSVEVDNVAGSALSLHYLDLAAALRGMSVYVSSALLGNPAHLTQQPIAA